MRYNSYTIVQAGILCGRSSRQESAARLAQTSPFMYASHGNGQHLCHRVLSVACSGFLTVAAIKCDVGATHGAWGGAIENVAQGPHSGPAAFPPRRGFGGAAKMFEERCFGHGQRKFGFPCLRRVNSPRRWKRRSDGERALRYYAGSCLMALASHDLFMRAFSTASGFLSITVK